MDFKQIIRMGLEEYTDEIRKALDGLTPKERRFQPTPESHHIDFAFWHIIRVEDEWLQGFARGVPTVWVRDGWPDRFATAGRGSGWGYDAEQIAALPAFDMDEMMSHFDAVRRETLDYLDSITEKDLNTFLSASAGRSTTSGGCSATSWSREPARRTDRLPSGHAEGAQQIETIDGSVVADQKPTYEPEAAALAEGFRLVAGMDEVGRGAAGRAGGCRRGDLADPSGRRVGRADRRQQAADACQARGGVPADLLESGRVRDRSRVL